MNPSKIIRCGVCGIDAVMMAQDPATGLSVGRCCHVALDDAHRMINLTMANLPNHGLRHPKPGEFTAETNH